MDGSADAQFSLAAAELRQFIEHIEQLEAEKRDIADSIKEVYAEAKGRGYLTMPMRSVVKERRRKPDDVAEERAVLEMYRSALGMA